VRLLSSIAINIGLSGGETLGIIIEPASDHPYSFYRSKYPPVRIPESYLWSAKQIGDLHILTHPITFKQPLGMLIAIAVSFEVSSPMFSVKRWARPFELEQPTSDRNSTFTATWPQHAESRLRLELKAVDEIELGIVLTIVGRMSDDTSTCLLAVDRLSESPPQIWSIPDECLSDRQNFLLRDGRMVRISLRRMRKEITIPISKASAVTQRDTNRLPGRSRRHCIRIEHHEETYLQEGNR
jgi:hypothetical protein